MTFQQGLANNYFRLCSPRGFCYNHSTLVLWCESNIDNKQTKVLLCSNKTLFTKLTVGYIWPVEHGM